MKTSDKMIGKKHRSQCDCNIEQHVSGKDEKCNRVHGVKRQRSKEKVVFRKELDEI